MQQSRKKNEMRLCPKCSAPIYRTAGCDHMTCKPPGGCGYEFCWLCSADFEPIIEYGNHRLQTRRQGKNARNKAQDVLEDRLHARREERELEELQAKVQQLEKELSIVRGNVGEGGAIASIGAQTIESLKARILTLEVELDEAEISLKDLTLMHACTQNALTSALSQLSTLTSHDNSLSHQRSTLSSFTPNSPDKSSGIEARQLGARVDHLGRQLDAKAKELARENHALSRVSSEIQSLNNTCRSIDDKLQ
ncbi:hypothetical protein RQP46_008703 [Phenoliferia psychrophenolica]